MTHESSQPETGAGLFERPEPIRVMPRSTMWFDRSDRIAYYFLLAAVPIIAAFGNVVGPVLDWIGGKPMIASGSGQTDFPNATIEQLSGVRYDFVSATIYLDHPSVGQRLIGLLLPSLAVGFVAVVSLLLYKVERDIARGYAFQRGNVARFRWLGFLTMLAGAVWVFAPNLVAAILVPSAVGPLSTTFNFFPLGIALIIGFTCFMLSQAFTVGKDLTDDAAEVI